MKKFLFTLLILTIGVPVYAKNINFIHVTDVHLTQANAHYLKEFTNEINNKYQDFDFVVFTGDNINRADRNDLDSFLNIIKDINLKVFVTVGNHDLLLSRDMTADYYMQRTRKILGKYHPSSANYIFKKGNLVFIAMNGVKEVIPGPNGYYKESEIIWLDRQLTKFKNKKVVILQHFPLLDTNSRSAGLYKKESYFNVLNKHNNVIAVVSGHYHNNREEKINNVYHIVTEKFSDNTYYKIISINDEDGFIYTTLVDKSSICAD